MLDYIEMLDISSGIKVLDKEFSLFVDVTETIVCPNNKATFTMRIIKSLNVKSTLLVVLMLNYEFISKFGLVI